MMMVVNWTAVCVGLAAGALMSAVFFAGLAWGMRYALRGAHPVKALIVSAALRIALFLGVGWAVVSAAGPWAFAGYAAAFLILRVIVTSLAKVPPKVPPKGPVEETIS